MGRRFGNRYKINRELKRGGMGRVYLAYDTKEKRMVALKVFNAADSDEARAEIKAGEYGAKLQGVLAEHDSNVPKIWNFGKLDGRFYVDMEYVEGEDLSSVMARQKLPYDSVIRIGAAVYSSLDKAHNLPTNYIDGQKIDRVFHGDIKPANIRLTPDGQVKLLDFGIAKATSLTRNITSTIYGTLEYCSPELVGDGDMDVNSDLWAAGVMLYEMVAGKIPFRAKNDKELKARFDSRQQPDPLPADCPPLLRGIIGQALAFDLSERYRSAADVCDLLGRLDQGPTRNISAAPGRATAGATFGRWDGIDIRDRHTGVTGFGGGSPVKSGIRIGLILAAAVFVVLSAVEFKAWQRKERLREDLRGAQVLHHADVVPLWARYQQEAARGVFGWGLSRLRDGMREKLLAVPQRVIDESGAEQPQVLRSNWEEARNCLAWMLELGNSDPRVKAMLLYCDGHLARIDGDNLRDDGMALLMESRKVREQAHAQKKAQEGRTKKEAASASYQKAVQHFRDASVLQPQWPHPRLGLTMIYTYGKFDVEHAAKELEAAKALGLKLGRRETALCADRLVHQGDALYSRAKQNKGSSADNYEQVLALYRESHVKLLQIPDFTKYTRSRIKEVEEKIKEVEGRIERRNEAAKRAESVKRAEEVGRL
jgi:hypothetical protein